MRRETHIVSYFSLPTDFAGEMRDWAEFVSGQGYSVELQSSNSAETVSVRYVEEEDQWPYAVVRGEGTGTLYDRALGKVAYALADHSDNVMVVRFDRL